MNSRKKYVHADLFIGSFFLALCFPHPWHTLSQTNLKCDRLVWSRLKILHHTRVLDLTQEVFTDSNVIVCPFNQFPSVPLSTYALFDPQALSELTSVHFCVARHQTRMTRSSRLFDNRFHWCVNSHQQPLRMQELNAENPAINVFHKVHDCNVSAHILLNFMWFSQICTASIGKNKLGKVNSAPGWVFCEERLGGQPEGTRHTAHTVSLWLASGFTMKRLAPPVSCTVSLCWMLQPGDAQHKDPTVRT